MKKSAFNRKGALTVSSIVFSESLGLQALYKITEVHRIKKGILKNSRYASWHLNWFLGYLCAHKRFSNLI